MDALTKAVVLLWQDNRLLERECGNRPSCDITVEGAGLTLYDDQAEFRGLAMVLGALDN